MRSIKKLSKSTKAVAGSALLLGATLVGAAGAASADLGDYPSPFVNEDGEVDTAVVVGDDAATIDVVGAINVAGSLSQAAYTTEEQTVEVSGVAGWSAENGQTLDTRNQNLFFGNELNEVRTTLTDRHLDALSETRFTDDDGEDHDVRYRLSVPELDINFGNSPERLDDEDPELHVEFDDDAEDNPVFTLNARMNPAIDFDNSDVHNEDIELFGSSYTIDEHDGDSEISLFRAAQTFSLENGEDYTVDIDGEEHTIEVVAVTGQNEGTIRINGQTRSVDEEGASFSVGDNRLRVNDIFDYGGDRDGEMNFLIGEGEIELENEAPVQDEDGDDIDGTYVEINGGEWTDTSEVVNRISLSIASEDEDEDAVLAGESFTHDFVSDVEFHYGGQNPDTTDADQDDVSFFNVDNDGSDEAEVTFTNEENEEGTFNFATIDEDPVLSNDGDRIGTFEGDFYEEDEYFTANPGDFSRLFEVEEVDYESDADDTEVEIEDVFTGETFTINTFDDGDDNSQVADEVIDGQEYYFHIDADENEDAVQVTWGDGAEAGFTGYETALFSPVNTEIDGAVTMLGHATPNYEAVGVTPDSEDTETIEVTLPSTVTSDDATVTLEFDTGSEADGSDTSLVTDAEDLDQSGTDLEDGEVEVGGVVYEFTDGGEDNEFMVHALNESDGEPIDAGVAMIQPEDDEDEESSYVVSASDDGDGDVELDLVSNPGTIQQETLESDDDLDVGYDIFGSYHVLDNDDEGEFTLHTPDGQGSAGAAFTDEGGSLSADGGASSATYDETTLTGWPDAGALDVDEDMDARTQEENMILVGGPAVNTLTQELADDGETWQADEYEEGDQLIQHISGAFHADHDALVVAGYSGEDTRSAANYLANYADHQDELAGQDQVNLQTMTEESAQ